MTHCVMLSLATSGFLSPLVVQCLVTLSACVGIMQLALAVLLAIGDARPSRLAGLTPLGQSLLGVSSLLLATSLELSSQLDMSHLLVLLVAYMTAFVLGRRVESLARRRLRAIQATQFVAKPHDTDSAE